MGILRRARVKIFIVVRVRILSMVENRHAWDVICGAEPTWCSAELRGNLTA
jgi:hypothetical protein